MEPRHLRDGHVARHASPDHHPRPPARAQQRDQRDREPPDPVPSGPAVDDLPELPDGSRGRRRRRPPGQPLGQLHQARPTPQLAYDVFGDGKTAVRGSVGLYYGRDVMALYESYFLREAVHRRGRHRAERGHLEPLAHQPEPDLHGGAPPVHRPEPGDFAWPSQVSGLRGMSPDYCLASSTQWNLGVEREIARGVRLEASYQGNNSTTSRPASRRTCPLGRRRERQRLQLPVPPAGPVPRRQRRLCVQRGPLAVRPVPPHRAGHRSGLFAQFSWAYTHARRNFGGTTAVQGNRDWDSAISYPSTPA